MSDSNQDSGPQTRGLTEEGYAHIDNLYALSTSVGSGKTRAAILYAFRQDIIDTNIVFVCPTVYLAQQTHKDLKEQVAQSTETTRTVEVIHSETERLKEASVHSAVYNRMAHTGRNMGATLVVTTKTFLRVCGWLTATQKRHWSVIFDEAFSPIYWTRISMGSDAETQRDNWDTFHSIFQFQDHPDISDRLLVVAADGRHDQVEAIAKGDWETAGDQHRGLASLAAETLADLSETEVVDRQAGYLDVGSTVTPKAFASFQEVVFLAALFEWTLLHAIWRASGVPFQRHTGIEANISRDLHTAQGPRLRIGHVLHPNDSASKRTLQRDAETGKPNESGNKVPVANQVIQNAIAQADAKFPRGPSKKTETAPGRNPGKDYLLQLNTALGLDHRIGQLLPRAKHIGAYPHGIDDLGHFQHLAALAVMNPEPGLRRWLRTRFSLGDGQIDRAVRLHPIYQAIGRILRDPACPYSKTVLVLSREDAGILHQEVFPDATWLGQVGSLESFTQKAYTGTPGRPRKCDQQTYTQLRKREEPLRKKKQRGTATEDELAELQELRDAKRSLSTTRQRP